MDPLAIMVMVSNRAVSTTAHSALPDAPVIPVDDTRITARARGRAAAAQLLRRLADVVAPPTRQVACVGGE